MLSNRRPLLLLLATLVLVALAVSALACGDEEGQPRGNVEGEAVYVDGLVFNVTSSRYMDREDKEDAAYLIGRPAPGSGRAWSGVFMKIRNESNRAQGVPVMRITAAGTEYAAFSSKGRYPLKFGERVEPGEELPRLDPGDQEDSVEGAFLIFNLDKAAARDKPVTLQIEGPLHKANVKLDF